MRWNMQRHKKELATEEMVSVVDSDGTQSWSPTGMKLEWRAVNGGVGIGLTSFNGPRPRRTLSLSGSAVSRWCFWNGLDFAARPDKMRSNDGWSRGLIATNKRVWVLRCGFGRGPGSAQGKRSSVSWFLNPTMPWRSERMIMSLPRSRPPSAQDGRGGQTKT